ncbi:MAG TPA: sn-glycerol-1-phosphate dehydrogenase [Clostridiaceae bacterium]|nr:sn-glycerol-1-phosphate dehydrogenase [Clostridiaceae bacterium]
MNKSGKSVEDLLNTDISNMAGMSFYCDICKKDHSVDIEKIIIEKGAVNKVPTIAAGFKAGKVFLVADNNTYPVCGEKVENLLKAEGFKLKTFVFNTPNQLVPGEQTLGRLLIEVERDTELIVAVGSGVINDMCRYLSYKMDIPYIIVGTAPSMDGYASVVTPTIVDGIKATLDGVYPYAIIGDLDILKEAPMEMLNAGFGDILGKLIALTDWDMSRQLNGEKYCDNCASFVKDALEKCISNIDGIKNREEKAIKYLMEALVLAGVTMGMFGNSRPASGAEHHYAHYWDEDAISRGEDHPLHGNSVGVGTVIAAEIYKLIGDRIPVKVNPPTPDEVKSLLKQLGACDNPRDLGINKDLFRRSILHSKDNRPKFTISHLAGQMGLLEEFSEILTEKFYG